VRLPFWTVSSTKISRMSLAVEVIVKDIGAIEIKDQL
jgi:hypothetical protein